MKDKNLKEILEDESDKKSNSSVLNLSLSSTKEIGKENISSDNISELKRELMEEISLPIEKEIDSIKFGLEKEIDLENVFFLENNIKIEKNKYIFQEKLKTRKRSKSFKEKKNLKRKNCHLKEDPSEFISPLNLCRKTFGNIPKWNKKSNEVLYNFHKNKIDNKSCNDDDSQDDLFLLYSETERATPNPDDLNNLLDCRKKMILFKSCISDRSIKEYENILNSDYIFVNKDVNNTKHHQRKSKNWYKYIRQQQTKSSNKTLPYKLSRLSTANDLKRSDTINPEQTKDHGLFILGILESAANERKGRNTVNI